MTEVFPLMFIIFILKEREMGLKNKSKKEKEKICQGKTTKESCRPLWFCNKQLLGIRVKFKISNVIT